ncbi:hypothetical protein BGW80DRAFT_309873 [Lactifluus volemus]|nr:hypothetical protein BGW80DRAFT_309873 [Lactifluus volemus]
MPFLDLAVPDSSFSYLKPKVPPESLFTSHNRPLPPHPPNISTPSHPTQFLTFPSTYLPATRFACVDIHRLDFNTSCSITVPNLGLFKLKTFQMT